MFSLVCFIRAVCIYIYICIYPGIYVYVFEIYDFAKGSKGQPRSLNRCCQVVSAFCEKKNNAVEEALGSALAAVCEIV